MVAIDYLILTPLLVLTSILGSYLYDMWFKKQPQRIIYAVDITLRGADETMDDFIQRAYAEDLGEYRIV